MYAVRQPDVKKPDVWSALADPTRRELIDRLAIGPKTTSELCAGFSISRFGVMKHLGILERADIVIARRHGRLRLNHLNISPLLAIQNRWVSVRASQLADSVSRIANTVEGNTLANDSSSPGVVDITLDWTISAPVQAVWKAIFERPHEWWPKSHLAGPEGSEMVFEPRIGGQLREQRPDGAGVVWYSVIALDPMRSIDLSGQLASRYGGPATSLLYIEIRPGEDDGSSVLKLTDSVFGRIGPDMRTSLSTGWQAIIGEGLVGLFSEGD